MSRLVVSGGLFLLGVLAIAAGATQAREQPASLVSLALRVHRLPEMERFYSEAFGIRFTDVTTGPVVSRFGRLGSLTLKLVPIRSEAAFDEFPVHQPGFAVPDIERVLALADQAGGRIEGEPVVEDGVVVRAAVRDPDGNTIELERMR